MLSGYSFTVLYIDEVGLPCVYFFSRTTQATKPREGVFLSMSLAVALSIGMKAGSETCKRGLLC